MADIDQRERLAALAGDVGLALTRSGTLQHVLHSCAESLVRNLDAAFARIWTLNAETNVLELVASEGIYTHLDGPHSRVPVGKFKIGLIAQERLPHLTNSVSTDPRVGNQEWAKREGMVAFAGYPLIVEDELVGVMALFSRHELTNETLRAMETVAYGIALAIRQKRDDLLRTVERHRAESAQLSYRMLAESIPQQVWTAQPDGHLDYVNQRCADYFGRTSAELLGAGWLDVLHADDAERCIETWNRSLQSGELYEVEFRLLRSSDSMYRWHLGRAVAMRDEAGQIIRWLGTNTDIHDRKQAEQDLQAAKAAADAANLAKSQFLASMSHELRTPLNAVIGYSEMLQEEAVELGFANLVPDLQKIHRAGGYLLTLINNVLDLSKIEAGKMELFLEQFEIGELIHAVVDTVEPLIQKNGNLLEVSCPPDIGSMRSDQNKARQCLFNLISNAAKFTEQGTVRLDVARSLGRISFRVADTGVGLSPEQIARLFEPFSQVHVGREGPQHGTGLGLAITRRLAQMLGGDISLESEPGKGSVFTITLPAGEALPHAHVAAVSPNGAPGNDTVLMVEDDPIARDLMLRLFRKEGYDAVIAETGLDALRLAKELRPTIITLDVIMPEMDGWSVLSALKADPEVCDIPVIMVTILDNQKMGYALGATDYLTKPIDRGRLSAVLEKYRSRPGRRSVLLVEDSEPDRILMRRVLEDAGWTVTEAENGAVGLDWMARQTPSLVILDLLMPEVDGFEFAHRVRNNEKWRGVPIIVTTAQDLTAQDRARLTGQVAAILSKGAYSMDELLREIRDLAVQHVS